MVTNRLANAAQNGYRFHAVASVSLLLDYLHEFDSIKNESNFEDIDLILLDGTHVCAQAKSSYDEESSDSTSFFNKALVTLKEAQCKLPGCKSIYMTNIRKMLGANTDTSDFSSGETVWYSSMSEDNIDLINERISADFDTGSFGIQFLKFEDGDRKDKPILDKMDEIFTEIEYLDRLSYKHVYETWLLYLSTNAT